MNVLRITTCLIVLFAALIAPEKDVLAVSGPPRTGKLLADFIPHQCPNLDLPIKHFLPIIFADGSGSASDLQAPLVTDLLAGSFHVNSIGVITANIDDSATGASPIASAAYQLDGGSWTSMEALDCTFSDQVIEPVIAFVPPFTASAMHTLCVRGTDIAGNLSQPACVQIPISDPSVGFVTGGGWIWTGGHIEQSLHTRKVSFGFVAKYLPGKLVPQGSLELNIKNEAFNFHAAKFQWLVVDTRQASVVLRGSGRLNGIEGYQFQLWIKDAKPDTFHIKIWLDSPSGESVVFDNQSEQPLDGGNIVIHQY